MQNVYSLEFLAGAFRCHVHHHQCFVVLLELAVMKFIFSIHGCWDSRDISVVGVFDYIKECMNNMRYTNIINSLQSTY
jgi:hypothetical protein